MPHLWLTPCSSRPSWPPCPSWLSSPPSRDRPGESAITDPLYGDTAPTRTRDLVDKPQPIRAIITDPQATRIDWELRAIPDGDPDDEGTLLLTGTGPVGAANSPAKIGTLAPSSLPDGFYTLQLIVTAVRPDTSEVTVIATQHLQIRAPIKLGNLALPVTDLTHDVPSPLSVSRNYDSQRAGEDDGLGFGWSLDSLQSALTTTMEDHYGSGPSLAWNDLIHVTLPTGQRHAFAFQPIPMITTSAPGAGLVMSVSPYIPNFVPVDGSAATLQASDVHGNPQTDDAIQWDSANGYMFKATEKPGGYTPKTHGGHYLLTTVDGTRYVINASTNQLHSRIDLLGRVEKFDTNPSSTTAGSISTTLGDDNNTKRTYSVTPEWTPDSSRRGKHITAATITLKVGSGTPTTLHKVTYTYDERWNLTAATITKPGTSEVLRTATYDYDANHRLNSVTDARGIEVLTAAYGPTGQLTKLTNLTGASAQTAVSHSSDASTQSVTDPSGSTKTENIYDDHGNVTREIRAVFDPAGKTLQHYVVTLHEYGYGNPSATDDASGRLEFNGKYENPWPLVNVLSYTQTSVPFTVPASRAGDRYLTSDKLASLGYLKTAPGTHHLLWASKQVFDVNNRLLDTAWTLRDDGNYNVTDYSPDALTLPKDTHVFGKPVSVRAAILTPAGVGVFIPHPTTYTYDTTTGQLLAVSDPAGQKTHYLYDGDTIPGTGYDPISEEWGAPDVADVPLGALYGTYRQVGYEKLLLTSNAYYDSTTATPTTPGPVAGLLSSTTDHTTGLTTSFTYWPDGRTAGVYKEWVDADNTHFKVLQSLTHYDPLGRPEKTYSQGTHLTQSTVGNHTLKVYDLDTNDANNLFTLTTYDENGQVLTTTDTYGGITSRTYDASGNLIRTTYPDGTETRTAYDSLGRVTWQTDRYYTAATPTSDPSDAYVALATHTTYDSQGRAVFTQRHKDVLISITNDTSVTLPGQTLKKSTPTSLGTTLSTSSTTYNPLGQVAQTTDPAGLKTGTLFYPNGQVRYTGVLKENLPDTGPTAWFNTLPDNPTPEQLQTLFSSYTSQQSNRPGGTDPTNHTAASHDSSTDPLNHTTTTYRDQDGLRLTTRYHDTTYSATYRNQPGWSIGQIDQWDSTRDGTWFAPTLPGPGWTQEAKVAQRRPDSTDPVLATLYLYDPAGRLTDIWLPAVDDVTDGTNDRIRPHWHYDYDQSGNMTKQVDPKGHETLFTYDHSGQRLTRQLPEGQTESWTYDSHGRTETHTDFAGHLTHYTYYPNSHPHAGQLHEERRYTTTAAFTTDPTHPAERTEYTYDTLGRTSQVDEYTSTTLTRTETTTYDPLTGQIASVTTPEGAISYEYDPATGQHTRTSTTHNDTTYEYDPQGRLNKVIATKLNGQTLTPAHETIYEYDNAGNLKTITQPRNLLTTYSYDALNRLDLEVVTQNAEEIARYDYHLRPDGLRSSVDEHQKNPNGTFSDVKITWTYDPAGRLIAEFRDDHSGSNSLSTDLIPDDPTDYLEIFSYDLSGNRHQKLHDEPNSTNDSTTTYTYTDNDQLESETTSGVTTQYDYDNNGSMTAKGPDTYTWDLRNRMSSATVGGVTTNYAYDPTGQRISETPGAGGDTTFHLQDHNNPTGYPQTLEEKLGPTAASATLARSYLVGLTVLGQSDTAIDTAYFVRDGHGSNRMLLGPDAQGATVILERFDYQAFGDPVGFDPQTASTPHLFGGDGEYTKSNNLTYHDARWRHGFTFTSFDSFEADPGSPADLHKYLYSRANPVAGTDPTGQFCFASSLV